MPPIGGLNFGHYTDACYNKQIFNAANQSATAYSVALATTYTGLVLSNPAGSSKNLALLQASFVLSVAPVGIATIGLFGGFSAAGIVTHTTPLTVSNMFLGAAVPASQAKADAAATLVGSPAWIHQFLAGMTAGALSGASIDPFDFKGSIIIPPGGYVGIGALTAATGFGALSWMEIAL